MEFSSEEGIALTVDNRGIVRVWDTGVGVPVTKLPDASHGETVSLGFTDAGQQVVGLQLESSAGASSKITSVSVLSWNTGSGRLVHQIPLPGISPSSVPCSAALQDVGKDAALAMLSGSYCGIPPPPNLVHAVPVPRPSSYSPGNAVMELLALAMNPDGRYIAYARSRSVTMIALDGKQVASLPLNSTPTGLSFSANGDDVVVMTDTAIYLWRPLTGQRPLVLPQPRAPIDAELDAAADRLATANAAGTVGVWSTVTGKLLRTFRPVNTHASLYFQPTPLRVALSTDGGIIASGNADSTVFLWNVATGKRIAVHALSPGPVVLGTPGLGWPIIELSLAANGSRLLAVDWPQAGSGVNPPGAAAVLDLATGHVVASYRSPAPLQAPINPGAALSPDGAFLFAGALGLAPSSPGGTAAAYQISSGQVMENFQAAVEPASRSYSLLPAQPWAPDGAEVLVGNTLYGCDACGSLAELQAAAASRIAWEQPLSQASDHPPATDPYR